MTGGTGCGAPAGGLPAPAPAAAGEAVIEGQVTVGGEPLRAGYARLLDGGGEFVAEVPLGEDGGFRFFAAPGAWTVRVLAPGDTRADHPVTADRGRTATVAITV